MAVISFSIGIGIGIVIGILIFMVHEDDGYIKKLKQLCLYSSCAILISIILGLLIKNHDAFFAPPRVYTFKGLLKVLLNNSANVQLVSIGVFALLLVLISLVVRLPFIGWEQINIFGFEARRLVKTQEMATEEFKYNRKFDFLRMQVVETIGSQAVYETLRPYVNNQQFDALDALEEVMGVVESSYRTSDLQIRASGGVVTVENNQLDPNEIGILPNSIREAIHFAFRTGKPQRWSEGDASTVAVPVSFNDNTEPFYIVYLNCNEHRLVDSDEVHLSTIMNIVKNYVERAALEEVVQQQQAVL